MDIIMEMIMANKKKYNINVIYTTNSPVISWELYPDAVSYKLKRGSTKENLEIILVDLTVASYKDENVTVSVTGKENRTTIYYDVVAVLEDGTEINYNNPTFYTPSDIEYPMKGILKEIIRRNNIMLRIGAENCTIYQKKTFGTQCPKCWNKLAGNSSAQEPLCTVCYNSGFIGGYNKFITKIMIRDAPDGYVETPFGIKRETMGKQGWLVDYPLIHSGDMFIEPNGDRWSIDNVNVSEVMNIVTNQIASITFLESSHPFYQINL